MRKRHSFRLCAAVLTLAGMAALPAKADGLTVGDFLRSVATAMSLPSADAIIAEASLRAAGFPLPAVDRSAGLTEGAVAAISNAVGLRITSSNPAGGFGERQLAYFMTSMTSRLSAARGPGADDRGPSVESSRSRSHSGARRKPHSKSPKKPKRPRSRDHTRRERSD